MFPLHANYLQYLCLILCNDVVCKVIEIIIIIKEILMGTEQLRCLVHMIIIAIEPYEMGWIDTNRFIWLWIQTSGGLV
jgi:hypothetical protein